MCTQLFDVKQDYVFKKIFGSESHPNILISFLNACFKGREIITEVSLKNTKVEKEFIDDSYSRLDILAKTDKGEVVNIEMQRADEKNMIKRSLYYWAKTYSGQYAGKSEYEKLPRTICINVLEYSLTELSNTSHYHNTFRLQNLNDGSQLTDTIEMQFIELPKVTINKNDALSLWSQFIGDANSVEAVEAENIISEIHEARTELARLSRDPQEAERYRMREKSLADKYNALLGAEARGEARGKALGQAIGKATGEQEKALSIAKSMLDIMPNSEIAKHTGLAISEIEALR